MSGSSNSDESSGGESVLVTPYHKQMLLKPSLQPLNIGMPPSSDGDNRLASIKEDCESPLSSWDSEPETDIPSTINCYGNYLDVEEQNQFVGVENMDDNLLWEMDNRSYDELLKKFDEKVEELTISNFKLQLLEKEIIKLKANIQNSEGQLDNVRVELRVKGEELHKQRELSKKEIFKLKTCIEKSENQLDYVQEELKLKKDELQKQTAELDTHANLVEQLEAAHAKLKISKDENAMLRDKLESKSSETYQLQGQLKVAQENMTKSNLELVSRRKEIEMLRNLVLNKVIKYDTNEANHNQYVRKLKSEISDSQAKYSSDIASLSKIKINLTSKLEDCEARNKVLENKLRRYKDEKLKQEEIHATQQMVLLDKIGYLMEERGQRMHDVKATCTDLAMVTIERDEVSKPDVFKSPNSETYPMFGEAKIEDLSSQLQTQAAQQFRMPDMGFIMAKQAQGAEADRAQPEEEEEVGETGVEAFGIELVMTQAGVSRSKAVKALKTHNGDIVTAIMELVY